MPTRIRQLPVALLVAVVALVAGGGSYAAVALSRGLPEAGAPAAVVQPLPSPSYPAPPPDAREQLAPRLEVVPPAGSVRVLPGPFVDRVRFDGLRLRQAAGGTSVTGDLVVTTDVSELIVADVVVGFYDARGALLGSGTATLRDEHDAAAESEEPPAPRSEGEPHPFAVTGPRGAASASVSLPTLVNE